MISALCVCITMLLVLSYYRKVVTLKLIATLLPSTLYSTEANCWRLFNHHKPAWQICCCHNWSAFEPARLWLASDWACCALIGQAQELIVEKCICYVGFQAAPAAILRTVCECIGSGLLLPGTLWVTAQLLSTPLHTIGTVILLIFCCLGLKPHCSNVVQLWSEVKFDFDPISAVICVALMWVKCWYQYNSEPPSDLRSNFDLVSTQWMSGYHCFNSSDEINRFESCPTRKTSSYWFIRPLVQLCFWSVYVRFLLSVYCHLFAALINGE